MNDIKQIQKACKEYKKAIKDDLKKSFPSKKFDVYSIIYKREIPGGGFLLSVDWDNEVTTAQVEEIIFRHKKLTDNVTHNIYYQNLYEKRQEVEKGKRMYPWKY